MSLLCFSMNFALSADETAETLALTHAAYDAWVLVNDYFSWDKEWRNHQANGSTGVIASAMFLYMKWYSVDADEARRLLRSEIISREERYCQAKEDFLARGKLTEKTIQWLDLLDLVTAGNFAWSMTTARYHQSAEDGYPSLRTKHHELLTDPAADSLNKPISQSAEDLANSAMLPSSGPGSRNDSMDLAGITDSSALAEANRLKENGIQFPPEVAAVPSLYSYEEVSVLRGATYR